MTVSTTLTTEQTAERTARIEKTIAYYIAFIGLGLIAAVLGPTLQGLAAHTTSHINEISFLFTAKSLGYLVGSLQAGRLYDRIPGHPVLAAMLGLAALMLLLAPTVPWLGLLALVVLILGIAEGTVDVGANTLLVWVHGREVGAYMNGLHFFFGLGAFLAPTVIAWAIVLSGDINWAYWTLALLTLPAIPLLLRSSSPQHQAASRAAGAGPVKWLLVALLALFFFLYVGAEGSFGGWIYTYTTALGLANPEVAGYLTSAYWGALTLGRLLGIPIARRLRPRVILLVDLVGSIVGVSIILLWPHSLTVVWIGTLGTGLATASVFPTLLSFAERRMTITAAVSSWFFVGSGLGGMVLPSLIGQLFDPIGPAVTMYAILVSLFLLVGLLGVLIGYADRRPALARLKP